MSRVPWHVKGVRPNAREVARDAARRSGLSVGEWLNSLIIDAAANANPFGEEREAGPIDPPPRAPRPPRPRPPDADARFAAEGRDGGPPKRRRDRGPPPRQASLPRGRRRETARDEGWEETAYSDAPAGSPGAPWRRDAKPYRRPADDDGADLRRRDPRNQGRRPGDDGVDAALAEITARQRMLDQPHGAVPEGAPSGPVLAQTDPARVEQQLRDIAGRIKALQAAARSENRAEGAGTVEPALPQQTIDAIDAQLRRLTSQLDGLRSAAIGDQSVETLRHDLADLANRVDAAMPRGAAGAIQEQIRALASEIAELGALPRIEEIAARLRHDLDGIAATLESAIPQRTAAAIADEIQALHVRIADLGTPPKVFEITEALRRDLVEIGAVLHEALPTNALAALEHEVRTLGERIDRGAATPMPGSADGIADIHDRRAATAPAGDIARLSEAIAVLSEKADAMAADRMASEMVEQLEQAIGTLHAMIAQAASQDAVDSLARDIHALADKVDHSTRQDRDADLLMTLDRRLAEMADAISRRRPAEADSGIPADLEATIGKLADRLESIQIADPGVLKSIEQHIVTLAERLDRSDAGLGRIEVIERGMGDLLAQVRELQAQNDRKLAAMQRELVASTTEAVSTPAEAMRRDVATLKEIQTSADRRTQDTFEAVYGTIEQMVDRLAVLEEGHREAAEAAMAATAALRPASAPKLTPAAAPIAQTPVTAPAAAPIAQTPVITPAAAPIAATPASAPRAAPPQAPQPDLAAAEPIDLAPFETSLPAVEAPIKPAARPPVAQVRAPINTQLPPDAPLEPGSGPRRVRMVASAIDRIAVSEAVNNAAGAASSAGAKPEEAAAAARSSFVAAARRAAQAVADQHANAVDDKTVFDRPQRRSKLMQKFGPRIKSLVVGISVVMLVLGALRLALDLFYGSEPSPPATPVIVQPSSSRAPLPNNLVSPAVPVPPAPPAALPAAPPLSPAPAAPAAPPAGKGAGLSSPGTAATRTMLPPGTPLSQAAMFGMPADLMLAGTGARLTSLTAAPQPQPAEPTRDLAVNALPTTIGGKALINAATAGDPGASFEVGSRYAEGRAVPQDLATAAAWFDRAARSGMALAQFRLASMNEKGLGVKRDLDEARRLYLAASAQGHAKAMHNLAVLYAEGIDGKPDYAVASQWFLKAAAYGVVDSEYNLAILYARGVGVERNLVESYKWFALAAKGGDADAAMKRDEVAARLDPLELQKAKQAADAFVPARQPDEATTTKAPPGGWDLVVAAAPTKPKLPR